MSLCLDTVAPGVANEKKLQQEAIDDLINTIDSEVKSPEAGVVLCGDFNHLPTKALTLTLNSQPDLKQVVKNKTCGDSMIDLISTPTAPLPAVYLNMGRKCNTE